MGTQPVVIVIAGPNGAGKSTLAEHVIPEDITFINADEIAKTLPGYPSPGVDLDAGRLVLERMADHERRRANFAVETTLASRSLAPRIKRLRVKGYFFRLFFVWTPNAEFSIERVKERVRRGGHHIPEETIRRRYGAGIKNFFGLYRPLADEWAVIDNTRLEGSRLVAEGRAGGVVWVHDAETWGAMLKGARDG